MNPKLLYCIAISFCLISCNQLNGKIDYRQNKPSCVVYPSELISVDTARVVTTTENQPKNEDEIEKAAIESDAHQVYLINTSTSKSYAFTVKTIPNDSTSSTTSIIKLNPGEERWVGCDTYLTHLKKIVKIKYEVVGEQSLKGIVEAPLTKKGNR